VGPGDLNGDGFDDLVIGEQEGPAYTEGGTYFFFGGAEGWDLDMLVHDADASLLETSRSGDVAAAGDLNGDGLADLLIGDPEYTVGAVDPGVVYLLFGRTSGWEWGADLEDNTISMFGEPVDSQIGTMGHMHGTGDVNGDGLDDVLIGACTSIDSGLDQGEVFLVLGRTSGWSDGMTVGASPQSFIGENNYDLACTVGSGGDVNGDGYDDFIVGARWNNEAELAAGKVYVIFGGPWIESLGANESLAGYAGAQFLGEDICDEAGGSVSIVQDVDGDGYDDLLVGADGNNEGGINAGKVYLVLGQSSGWAASLSLADADTSFLGEASGDYLGRTLATAGDVNGDGYGDFILGSPYNDEGGQWAGQVYLLLGRPSLWPAGTAVDEADASLVGEGEYNELHMASGLGDLNGDGFDDILAGTPYNDEGGSQGGKSYLVLGYECWDVDWDGHGGCEDDCDDYDANVFPGGPEVCDGKDSDCDGTIPADEVDADGDSTRVCEGDCDDSDPYLNLEDLDGDGFDSCDTDCDDTRSATYPGALEQCDGLDNDCDGVVPQDEIDGDGDGWVPCYLDCDDTNPDIHWGTDEICDDGVDNDCDGSVDGEDAECEGETDDDDDDDDDSASDDDSADDDDDSASDDDSADDDDVTAGDDDTQTDGPEPPDTDDCSCGIAPGKGPSSVHVVFVLVAMLWLRRRCARPWLVLLRRG
jgi:hypothetical protein